MQEPREGGGAANLTRRRVDAYLDQMRRAVQDELRAVRRSGGKSLLLANGQRVASMGERFLYHFESDTSPSSLPPETPVRLLVAGSEGTVQGTVVSCEDFLVLLELQEDVGDAVPQAELSTCPWQILERLEKRLEALQSGESDQWRSPSVLPALLGLEAPSSIADPPKVASATLEANQREAVRRAVTSSVHFVWGPPGTGKTRTLAETVRALLLAGERVLVTATSNVAVDVAMLRTAALLEGTKLIEEGRVLRVGTPHLPELRSSAHLLPEAILRRRHPALFAELDRLQEERRRLVAAMRDRQIDGKGREKLSRRLADLRRQLAAQQKVVTALTNALLEEAVFVGCTLAKLTIDDLLWTKAVDAVVIDEVSMACFAHAFAAASRASRRAVLFGDPRQLPPVHQAETEMARLWLGRDAFEVAGTSERLDDPRVSFLARQYRMAPEIAEVV